MKQLFLAAVLIALPVAGFTAVERWLLPATPETSADSESLGDLSAYEAIVTDAQTIAASGDLVAAEKRITDFETRWDDGEATLRPQAPIAWGNIDSAADAAFSALRAQTPDPSNVNGSLAALSASLSNPSGGAASAAATKRVSGIAVTDANGHAIPCETMLNELRSALSTGTIGATNRATATDLQAKATERCNADDDTHANAFSAQAIALAGN